jgi:photosystem II stability/assembly factor-like uncharacterized protein
VAKTYAVQQRLMRSKVSTQDPQPQRSHWRSIRNRKAATLSLIGIALVVASVTAAAAVGGNHTGISQTSTHATVGQAGGWNVPANEVDAPAVPTPGGAQAGTGAYNAVACATTNNCVAVGGDANLAGVAATSSDGGSTWTSASVETGQPELNAVACSSASECVAVGVGDAATSSDGGHTWTSVSIPTPNTTLLGVSCPTSSLCVSVGVTPVEAGPYEGELFVSSDGGSTWTQPQLPPHVGALGSVDCPSEAFCVAVGAEILVSTDGGQSWTPDFVNGGTGVLRNVSCASASECVAVGPNGQGAGDPTAAAFAVTTASGGETWTSTTMPKGSTRSTRLTARPTARVSRAVPVRKPRPPRR